jgi:hypothetical protein
MSRRRSGELREPVAQAVEVDLPERGQGQAQLRVRALVFAVEVGPEERRVVGAEGDGDPAASICGKGCAARSR